MLTSMSRIIGCFTVSVSTLFAIACSYQEMGFFFSRLDKQLPSPKFRYIIFWGGWDGMGLPF